MFWGKDKKSKKQTPKKQTDKRGSSIKGKAGCVGKNKGHSQTREAIHAEAMANFSSAKENIGEDTLERIAAAMSRKENSPMERARRELASVDTDKVLDELKWMLDQKT